MFLQKYCLDLNTRALIQIGKFAIAKKRFFSASTHLKMQVYVVRGGPFWLRFVF